MHRLPTGAWPVMLTPYRDDLSVDLHSLDAYTDWLIDLGVAGLFSVSLSSEMYDLSGAEQILLATRVRERAGGRVPVVASATAGGTWRAQADRVAQIAQTGVDAVVLISSLITAPDASESAWIDTVERILDANPGVDFGIYECPLPFKRLLPVHTVRWLAQTGRFTFYKDTSHSLATMTERLNVIGDTRMQLYNAAIASLVPSMHLGAAGLSGYAASVYPDLVAWLCRNAVDRDAGDVRRVQQLLTVIEHSVNLRYPTSAKVLLDVSSRMTWRARSRWKPEHLGDHESEPLRQLGRLVAELDLGRALLHPAR